MYIKNFLNLHGVYNICTVECVTKTAPITMRNEMETCGLRILHSQTGRSFLKVNLDMIKLYVKNPTATTTEIKTRIYSH